MTASTSDSPATQTVAPALASSCSARWRPAASTCGAAYRPVTPAPSRAGVLGMQRTTGSSPPSHCWIRATGMPAAMDTTSGRAACAGPASGSQAARMACGLTASSHSPAPATAGGPSSKPCTPKSATSAWRNSATGSATRMREVSKPRRDRPPIRLRAMLPPPMKARVSGEGGVAGIGGGSGWGRWAGRHGRPAVSAALSMRCSTVRGGLAGRAAGGHWRR